MAPVDNNREDDDRVGPSLDQFSGVDAQLLARNEEVRGRKEAIKSEAASEQPVSFREVMARERRKRLIARLRKEKKAQKVTSVNPLNRGTSALLRQAWLNLISSFGLTLIWINIHVFLRIILGDKLFCHLGDEWSVGGMKNPLSRAGSKKKGKIKERIGLGLLDGCGCLIIIAVLALVAMIVTTISNPLEALSEILGAIWQALK